jgi:hypothetical protein
VELVHLRQRVAILVTVSEHLGGHDVLEGGNVYLNTVDATSNGASDQLVIAMTTTSDREVLQHVDRASVRRPRRLPKVRSVSASTVTGSWRASSLGALAHVDGRAMASVRYRASVLEHSEQIADDVR